MAAIFKFILLFIVFYYIISRIKSFILPKSKENKKTNIRIFKTGDVEKSTMDIKDADDVEYIEIEKDKKVE